MRWRVALSVLSQRSLIFEEGLSFGLDSALFFLANSPGTGMFALMVTPTFASEGALLPPAVAAWKELMTFLKKDSHGSRC